MRSGTCECCGSDAAFSYTCNLCGGRFCPEHRLPENHGCPNSDYVRSADIDQDSAAPRSSVAARIRSAAYRLRLAVGSLGGQRVRRTGRIAKSLAALGVRSAAIFVVIAAVAWIAVIGMGEVIPAGEGGGSGIVDEGETAPNDGIDADEVEQLVHEKVNEERQAHAQTPMEHDDDLGEIARYHNERMIEEGFFAHVAPDGEDPDDRYQMHGYDCSMRAGENLAQTWANTPMATSDGTQELTNESEVAEEIVSGWMGSDGHRENLLSDQWSVHGVGVTLVEMDGDTKVYVTQNFC